MRVLVLYSSYLGTKKASYYDDWLDAFERCDQIDCEAHNIVPSYLKVSNPSKFGDKKTPDLRMKTSAYEIFYRTYSWFYTKYLKFLNKNHVLWDLSKIRTCDLIVLLHSTNADSVLALSALENRLKDRKGKLLVLVGNEYCLMPEKISFIQNVEADFIGSQLPRHAADWLYSDCRKSSVLMTPHALNESVYRSLQRPEERRIGIGFIGDRYGPAIGDIERTEMIEYFGRNDFGQGITKDIRMGRKLRLPRDAYVGFLNSIRGTIGAESGTYYLEKTDRTQKRVEAFLSYHPQATFKDVYDRFFRDYASPRNGKAISSRHFEAIGTNTCQILLEGRYNDILKADVHYISLKKDFSNIADVVNRFKDKDYCGSMVEQTREYILDCHTFKHRILDIVTETFS